MDEFELTEMGLCRECARWRKLTPDGHIAKHSTRDGKSCVGSGGTPAGIMSR